MNLQIINGNNIEVLKQYPDNHFDAVVTDPPYGLGKEPNAEQMLRAWIDTGFLEVSGSGFMGKEWDAFVPQPLFWKEVFRVLKPGGHILSFFGTRTYDWGVMAMRLAGFEVRDCIQWVYGSGFPKSYNVAKGIEGKIVNGSASWNDWKILDGEKEQVNWGYSKGQAEQGYRDDYTEANKERVGKVNFQSKEAKQWDGWGSALKPANEPIVLARKPLEKGLSIAENVLKWGTGGINIDGCRVSFKDKADYDESTQKNQHENFGTKPMTNNNVYGDYSMVQPKNYQPQGRFPANLIMSHHPECECVGTKKVKAIKGGSGGSASMNEKGYGFNKIQNGANAGGLGDENGEEIVEDWNCHEDCPIKIMDEQSGVLKSGDIKPHKNNSTSIIGGNKGLQNSQNINVNFKGDSGGASRFFYCAKASKSERNKGLDSERWFYNLELITDCCSFTEQNLFIWENEEQNQNTDLNLEVQQKKGISEGIVSIANDKECCTTLNGKNIMAVFPKAIKFTTKTRRYEVVTSSLGLCQSASPWNAQPSSLQHPRRFSSSWQIQDRVRQPA